MSQIFRKVVSESCASESGVIPSGPGGFERVVLAKVSSSSSVRWSGGSSLSLRGTAFSASWLHEFLHSSMHRMPRASTGNVDWVAGGKRELSTLL